MVFRYPADPTLDYIKRVVGLPGDRVEYLNKRLTVNGEAVALEESGTYLHPDRLYYSPQFTERLGEVEHSVLIEQDAPAFVPQVMNFPGRENCTYTSSGVACTVPAGHYFMTRAATAGCGVSCRNRTSLARPFSSGSISTT